MYKEFGEIEEAMEMLKSVHGKIAGFVVNDVEGKIDTKAGYGKYGYRKYGYGYGNGSKRNER